MRVLANPVLAQYYSGDFLLDFVVKAVYPVFESRTIGKETRIAIGRWQTGTRFADGVVERLMPVEVAHRTGDSFLPGPSKQMPIQQLWTSPGTTR